MRAIRDEASTGGSERKRRVTTSVVSRDAAAPDRVRLRVSRPERIRGEFVSGRLANGTDQLVIEAVVRVARGLGKETIELEAFLRAQGIDYAQRFHVGRPVAITEPRWRERPLV